MIGKIKLKLTLRNGGNIMFGAILGDMIGSPYEFNSHNYKAKDFPLFSEA